MAKKEIGTDAREAAWEKLLAKYEAQNPVKFAAKKALGAFDKIPASFKGKITVDHKGREIIE